MVGQMEQHTILHRVAKYVWTIPEPAEWSELMDSIAQGHGLDATNWRLRLTNRSEAIGFLGPARIRPGGVRSPGSGGVTLVFRALLKMRLEEHRLIDHYQRFVITRSDHVYGCPHRLHELSPHLVWVPKGEDYGGTCDRHIVCSRHHIRRCLSIIDDVFVHPERYADMEQLGHPAAAERFYGLRLQQLQLPVQRFPRMMFLVQAQNDSSSTRQPLTGTERLTWPPPASQGVHLKYVDEFVQVRWTCGFCTLRTLGTDFCKVHRTALNEITGQKARPGAVMALKLRPSSPSPQHPQNSTGG